MSSATERERSARKLLAEAVGRLQGATAGIDGHFREIFQRSFGLILVMLPDGMIVDANETALSTMGVPREDLIGTHIWDASCWPGTAERRAAVRASVATAARGAVVRYEAELDSGGTRSTLDLSLKPLAAVDGRVALILAEGRDVTDRERSTRAVRESEERLHRIISIAADAIVSVDESQLITLFNRGAEQIFGYDAQEVLGQPLDVLLPTELASIHRREVRAFAESGTVARLMGERRQIFGKRKNGEVFPAEASISRVQVGGRPVLTAVLRDVTERWARDAERVELLSAATLAQEEAEAAHARIAFLAEASDTLSESLDLELTLRALARLIVPRMAVLCLIDHLDPVLGARRVESLHADPMRRNIAEMLRRVPVDGGGPLLSGDTLSTGEPTLRTTIDDGFLQRIARDEQHLAALRALTPRSCICVPLTAHGHLLGAITLVRDASAPAYTAEDLRLAEDLAHRAALAVDNAALYNRAIAATQQRDHVLGVVSHDLRNPLSAIAMCASALESGGAAESPEERAQLLATVRSSVDWAQRLITDLLDISSIEAGRLSVEARAIDPVVAVARGVHLIDHEAAAKGLSLTLSVPDHLPPVRADDGRLLQVLSNLLTNAVKFTEPGGSITVSAEVQHEFVAFAVADTGPGIPPEHVPHVFDRFWHARRGTHARGSGLGLAIAKGIVEAHGGRIWVESTRGAGTTLRFTIPVVSSVEARVVDVAVDARPGARHRDRSDAPAPYGGGHSEGQAAS